MFRPRESRRSSSRVALAALLLCAGFALAPAAWARPGEAPAAPVAPAAVTAEAEPGPGARVLARFRADALRDGVLLRPLEESSAIRSIELVDDGEVLVNGKEFDEAELESFLGPDGALIAELARMGAGERRQFLGLSSPEYRADDPEDDVEFTVAVGAPKVRTRVSREDRVSVGRSIRVEAGETARDVICVGCSIELAGEAFGDAVAVGGHLEITGTVHGDAVAVAGSIDVGGDAMIQGDAVAVGGSLDVEPGGQVIGQRSSVGFGEGWYGGWGNDWEPFGVFSSLHGTFWSIFRAGLLALLVGLCVLVARPSVEASAWRVEREPWKALFAGLLTQLLFFPVLLLVTLILAVSIIGIPLLILVPVAILVLIFGNLVGFAGVAIVAGRALERRFGASLSGPFLVAVVGVIAIQMISIVGRLIGLPGGVVGFIGLTILALGFCVKYVAWTLGLGSMTLVALGREWRQPPPVGETGRRPPTPASGGADDFVAADETERE